MSVVKGKQEYKTILDFSNLEASKNYIKNSLRSAEVIDIDFEQSNKLVFIENEIQVGIFKIRLCFSESDTINYRKKLKDYGNFKVSIYECIRDSDIEINLFKDRKFKNQYWVKLNSDNNLKIKHLTDIIMYCSRLNRMKLFL